MNKLIWIVAILSVAGLVVYFLNRNFLKENWKHLVTALIAGLALFVSLGFFFHFEPQMTSSGIYLTSGKPINATDPGLSFIIPLTVVNTGKKVGIVSDVTATIHHNEIEREYTPTFYINQERLHGEIYWEEKRILSNGPPNAFNVGPEDSATKFIQFHPLIDHNVKEGGFKLTPGMHNITVNACAVVNDCSQITMKLSINITQKAIDAVTSTENARVFIFADGPTMISTENEGTKIVL